MEKTERFNIYLIGVGGQGIGLLSETLIRAADYAGLPVRGVDTHGLAQRGGIVQSHVRIGNGVHSPLIPARQADLVIAMERHEALRGLRCYLRDGGTLVYYNTILQPLPVRLGGDECVNADTISEECRSRAAREIPVFNDALPDSRMQNMVLLGAVASFELIPAVKPSHYEQAMEDLLDGKVLAGNLEMFRTLVRSASL